MNGFSRREFLTALLGSSVALAACKRRPLEPTFTGRLLGQSAERGHTLRDGFRPPPTRTEKRPVVIIGAGAAGLSAAWKLKKSGFEDFVVLELEDHLGGTSAWGSNAVSAHPWGAHYVPVPLPGNRALIELLTELGVIEGQDTRGSPIVGEQFLCRAPQERLFMAGLWMEGLYPRFGASAEDLRQLEAFNDEIDRWIAFRDPQGRRAFCIPIAQASSDPRVTALDQLSMAEFMKQKGWTSPRLRWFIEYGCRDDYGCTLETTSAWAGLFYFAARVDKPGGKGAEFVTWPEGNGHLIKHLAKVSEGKLRTGFAVTDVIPGEASVQVHAFDFAKREAVGFEAEQVIFALPHFIGAKLLAPWRENPPAFLKGFTYSSWVVANLTLSARPKEASFPLAWDNVLYESKGLGYVDATHQTGKDYGSTVWTYYLPLLDGPPAQQRTMLLGASWKHWADAILADLGRAHPGLASRITSLDVWRWGHAMIRPTVGLMRGPLLEAARQPLGRVHFANTDLSGMALFEEAQHWGVVAAEAILAERGVAFRSSL